MIERVPGALRAGEASSMGNNCTGMNAPSHNAPDVKETATPVKLIINQQVSYNWHEPERAPHNLNGFALRDHMYISAKYSIAHSAWAALI